MDVPWGNAPTIEEFLEELAFSDSKLEFFEGRIVAFAGGSIAHSKLCAKLTVLFSAVRRPGCSVLTSDAAVRVGRTAYVFPDLSYTCEALEPTASELVAPTVVVEVISPHSTRRDRVEKLRAYGQIRELEAYVLIDSLRPSATVFAREGQRFVQTDSIGFDSIVRIDALDLDIPLAELYRDVLATEPPTP